MTMFRLPRAVQRSRRGEAGTTLIELTLYLGLITATTGLLIGLEMNTRRNAATQDVLLRSVDDSARLWDDLAVDVRSATSLEVRDGGSELAIGIGNGAEIVYGLKRVAGKTWVVRRQAGGPVPEKVLVREVTGVTFSVDRSAEAAPIARCKLRYALERGGKVIMRKAWDFSTAAPLARRQAR